MSCRNWIDTYEDLCEALVSRGFVHRHADNAWYPPDGNDRCVCSDEALRDFCASHPSMVADAEHLLSLGFGFEVTSRQFGHCVQICLRPMASGRERVVYPTLSPLQLLAMQAKVQ